MREKITTANIDFDNSRKEHYDDVNLLTRTASVLLLQEARDTDLRAVLKKGWATNQRNSTAGTRGSAVCWDTSVWERKRSWLRLGADGKGLNPRFLSIQNLRHRKTGKRIRFISCHFPPARMRFLQPGMAAVLIAVVKTGRKPVIVGGDFNFIVSNDPYSIAKRTGLFRRSHGIDGFYLTKTLFASQAKTTNINSGHDAVSITVRV